MSNLTFNIIINTNTRYSGEVFQDGDRWGYKIVECTFPGNKNADPDFVESDFITAPYRMMAIANCFMDIHHRVKADTLAIERARDRNPEDGDGSEPDYDTMLDGQKEAEHEAREIAKLEGMSAEDEAFENAMKKVLG